MSAGYSPGSWGRAGSWGVGARRRCGPAARAPLAVFAACWAAFESARVSVSTSRTSARRWLEIRRAAALASIGLGIGHPYEERRKDDTESQELKGADAIF